MRSRSSIARRVAPVKSRDVTLTSTGPRREDRPLEVGQSIQGERAQREDGPVRELADTPWIVS